MDSSMAPCWKGAYVTAPIRGGIIFVCLKRRGGDKNKEEVSQHPEATKKNGRSGERWCKKNVKS